jgi:hypothetical protein
VPWSLTPSRITLDSGWENGVWSSLVAFSVTRLHPADTGPWENIEWVTPNSPKRFRVMTVTLMSLQVSASTDAFFRNAIGRYAAFCLNKGLRGIRTQESDQRNSRICHAKNSGVIGLQALLKYSPEPVLHEQ